MNPFQQFAGPITFSEQESAVIFFFAFSLFYIAALVLMAVLNLALKHFKIASKYIKRGKRVSFVLAAIALIFTATVYIFGSKKSLGRETLVGSLLESWMIWIGIASFFILCAVIALQVGLLIKKAYRSFLNH